MVASPSPSPGEPPLEKAARIIYDNRSAACPCWRRAPRGHPHRERQSYKAFIDIMGVLKGGSRIDSSSRGRARSFDEGGLHHRGQGGLHHHAGLTMKGEENVQHFRISARCRIDRQGAHEHGIPGRPGHRLTLSAIATSSGRPRRSTKLFLPGPLNDADPRLLHGKPLGHESDEGSLAMP
jgi:hypothetical protein